MENIVVIIISALIIFSWIMYWKPQESKVINNFIVLFGVALCILAWIVNMGLGWCCTIAYLFLLNSVEIVYSNCLARKQVDITNETLSAIAEDHITYFLTDEEGLAYVKMLHLKNWTVAEAFREWKYHKRGYYLTRYLFPKLAARFAYVDFEEKQTFKTYLFRFIGNCFL